MKESNVLLAAFLLVIALTSCISPTSKSQEPLGETNAPGIASKAAVIFTPLSGNTPEISWPTPQITATPIRVDVNSKEALDHLFSHLYFFTACRVDMLAGPIGPFPTQTFKPPAPEFIDVNTQSDPYMHLILETADNDDKTYQAFVACENSGNCHSKVFIRESFGDAKTYEINWDGRLPWRLIQSVIWISHNVVAFFQSNSPQVAQILAVDVEKKAFVYYSLVYNSCPLPSPTP